MNKIHAIIVIIIAAVGSFLLLLTIIPVSDEVVVEETEQEESKNETIPVENEVVNFNDNGEEVSIGSSVNTTSGYYYNRMTKDMKTVYDQLYNGIMLQKEKIKISSIDEKLFKKVFYCLIFDNPELFHVSESFNYEVKDGKVTMFYPEYTMKRKEYLSKMQEINVEINKVQLQTQDMSDYEKELFIQDYILNKCVYDLENENTNLYGALIDGRTNCRGYSATFSYLLNTCGVTSGQMIGTVDKDGVKEGHSWNFVILDDEYYYTDICWDDLAPSSDNTDITYCYAFFNLTYEEMKKTHNFDMQTEYLYEVNDSNSKKYSFMKSNGLYAYTYEQACEIIKTNLPLVLDYNKSLMIQCDDEETYNKLSENITDIIKNVIKETNISIKHCRYIKIENGYTIIVHDFVS